TLTVLSVSYGAPINEVTCIEGSGNGGPESSDPVITPAEPTISRHEIHALAASRMSLSLTHLRTFAKMLNDVDGTSKYYREMSQGEILNRYERHMFRQIHEYFSDQMSEELRIQIQRYQEQQENKAKRQENSSANAQLPGRSTFTSGMLTSMKDFQRVEVKVAPRMPAERITLALDRIAKAVKVAETFFKSPTFEDEQRLTDIVRGMSYYESHF
ncbi:hypothetical protein PFISCL1PPCAC_26452, partial [Pristionchus fissidentatus]